MRSTTPLLYLSCYNYRMQMPCWLGLNEVYLDIDNYLIHGVHVQP